MCAMAGCPEQALIGCTQVTEILNTPGVQLVAALPRQFELATVYTAAVCSAATEPQLAEQLVQLLGGETAQPIRRACGFAQTSNALTRRT